MIVHTTSGLELHGTTNSTTPGVRQFLGVPFAEPPLGELRFVAPVKLTPQTPASKIRSATAMSPSCMLPITNPAASTYNVFSEYLTGLQANDVQSEDCLYLDVYAPMTPIEELVPVFIFIHGGGFTSGGSNVPYQIPDGWVDRTQAHIVVTLNYRVNIFGFPNAAGQSLNVGLLDQRMAIEWVRDNIADFGGDPSRMILWGQSAGAWSVNYYSYAYHDDPIVKGLIPDSGGTTFFPAGISTVHTNFTSVATQLGCGNLTAADELACMQKVPATDVQAVYSNTTGVLFQPVADGVTVFPNSTKRANMGMMAQLPAILGLNCREGGDLVTNWTVEGGPTEDAVIQSSKAIVCPALVEIQNRAVAGLTTYRYLYTGNFSNVTPLPWIGAAHSTELPLLFGTHNQYNSESTDFEWELSYAMQDLWLAFARDPLTPPTLGSFTWPQWIPGNGSVAMLGHDGIILSTTSAVGLDSICS